jgi:hypothetical protein
MVLVYIYKGGFPFSCFKKREECVVFTRPSKLHVSRKDNLNARGWNFEEEHPKL